MTYSYMHSGYEAQESAAGLGVPPKGPETNTKYVKVRKAGPRGWPPERRKLLKVKVAGGRLELPTLGL